MAIFRRLPACQPVKAQGRMKHLFWSRNRLLKSLKKSKMRYWEKILKRRKNSTIFWFNLTGRKIKSNLGGNLILSLSLAFARLKAKEENLELFEYISEVSSIKYQVSRLPRPIFNVINGGAHMAHPESKLEIQEFQVIPQVDDFNMAFSVGKIFYRKLGNYLREKFGDENVVLGDEAGYSAPFKNNEEALECLAEVIEKYKYPLRIGLDVAASQFYRSNQESVNSNQEFYKINGNKYSAEELKDYYLKLIETYNIISIEDPFNEEAFDMFASLAADLCGQDADRRGRLVITDDLTTTNSMRLKTAIEKNPAMRF